MGVEKMLEAEYENIQSAKRHGEFLDSILSPPPSATEIQVGGNHYKDMKIQPVQYIQANNLGFCEGSVIKYVSRFKSKGGVEDLRKAKHFIDLLIEAELSEED